MTRGYCIGQHRCRPTSPVLIFHSTSSYITYSHFSFPALPWPGSSHPMLSPPTHLHIHPHRFKRHLWMIQRIIPPVDGWMEGSGRTFRMRGTEAITFGKQICSVAVVNCTKDWCGLILLPSLDFFVFIFVSLCGIYRTALLTEGVVWLFLNLMKSNNIM